MASYAFERLSAQDSSFLVFEDPHTHMHVGGVVILEAGPLILSAWFAYGITPSLVQIISALYLRRPERLVRLLGHRAWQSGCCSCADGLPLLALLAFHRGKPACAMGLLP